MLAVALSLCTPSLAGFTRRGDLTGNAFGTAAVFCRDRQPSFLTGFEFGPLTALGGFDAVTTSGGTPTVESALKRSGSYALRVSKAAGSSTLTKSSSGSLLVARIALSFDQLPTGDVAQLLSVGAAAGNAASLRFNAQQQRLEVAFGLGPAAVASAPVQPGAWNVIDLRVNTAQNPRTAEWQIGGVSQPQASSAEASSTVSGLTLGSTVAGDLFSARYDDLLMTHATSEYPLGPGRVLGLTPNGSPTSGHSLASAFRYDTGAGIDVNAYLRVDDMPMNSTADYISQTSASSSAYIQVELADPAAGCIDGVQAQAAFHSGSAGKETVNHAALRIIDGNRVTTVYSGSMVSTGLVYRTAVIAPEGTAWTSAALAGLTARFGYSTDVSPVPYWDAVLVEYDLLVP